MLSCPATVEVKGDYPTRVKAKELSESESLRERVIADTIKELKNKAHAPNAKNVETEIEDMYIVATEVMDYSQKVRYSIET